jgi:NitT/TauT family transport system substrate-binding protein
VIRFNVAARVALSLILVAACRPPVGGDAEPSASSIAGDLAPSRDIAVAIHLPGAPDALASAITKAAGSESIAGAGVQLEIVLPYAGEDAFAVRERDGQTDIFFATPAAALVAREAGNDLVMIAGLQRYAGMQLATLPKGPETLEAVASGSILLQGRPGDEAPLLAQFDELGIDRSALEISLAEDPSAPFDLYGLFDQTFAAASVNTYDGAARLQEFYDLESGLPVGPEGTRLIAGLDGDALSRAPGIGIWALRSALESEDHRIAMALTLIAIADGLAACRDDVAACAVVLEDSAIADRYGDGLLWSINAFNGTMWPAPNGAFTIDDAELTRAVNQAVATGVVSLAPPITELVDQRVVELALQNLPATIDLVGAAWTPLEVQLPLE